jgi:hypothetical protein
MPDPMHPHYGNFTPEVNVEQLRQTILDILVDVSVEQHRQIDVAINMSVLSSATHSVSMEPPLGTFATQGTWVANPIAASLYRDHYMAQYMAEWLPPLPPDPNDDRVDAHRIDRGYERDRSAYFEPSYVRNPVDRINMLPRRVTVPEFELASNPTVSLNAIRERRFDLYGDRMGMPPHPIIAAILRKKLGPKPELHRDEPPPLAQRLTCWERLRANYTLFE